MGYGQNGFTYFTPSLASPSTSNVLCLVPLRIAPSQNRVRRLQRRIVAVRAGVSFRLPIRGIVCRVWIQTPPRRRRFRIPRLETCRSGPFAVGKHLLQPERSVAFLIHLFAKRCSQPRAIAGSRDTHFAVFREAP